MMPPLNSRDSQLPQPSSSSSFSFSSFTKSGSISDEETKSNIQNNNRSCSKNNTPNLHRNSGSMTVDSLLISNVHDSNLGSGVASIGNRNRNRNRNPAHMPMPTMDVDGKFNASSTGSKTVDALWREIVAAGNVKELKEEVLEEMITLEDFLQAKAQEGVKVLQTERVSGGGVVPFDLNPLSSLQDFDRVEGFGNGAEMSGCGGEGGRGKRRRAAMEPMDEAAQQRQRRMIKNRESAARSRERKQAYQVELESIAARLEEENEQLLKEKAERAKERLKQLMEKVIPVVEKRRPPRVLCRVHSFEW